MTRQDGTSELTHYESNEFAVLGNFLACDGVRGRVIDIHPIARGVIPAGDPRARAEADQRRQLCVVSAAGAEGQVW